MNLSAASDHAEIQTTFASFFEVALRLRGTGQHSGLTPESAFADALERTPEFDFVVQSISQLKRAACFKNTLNGQDRIAMTTFFRRSGVYLDLYSGAQLVPADVVERLRVAFLEAHTDVTYLAPVELIDLSKDRLAFGRHSLRRFSREELALLTQHDIRKAFYPYSDLNLEVLQDYWYLVVTETVETMPMLDLSGLFDPRVRLTYSALPQAVEKALHPLVLCDWVEHFGPSTPGVRPFPRDPDDASFFPDVPFVIKLSKNYFEHPGQAPELEKLAREPLIDGRGEEVGDRPVYAFYFDEAGTIELENRLARFSASLTLIGGKPEWRFVETALGFLTKAFLSGSFEQLLWHVTSIEAVLGQDLSSGLTQTLKKRIAQIFGGPEHERKNLKKRFDELYKFRSDLVHGNADLADKKIVKGQLREARDFARGVVVWGVQFLDHIAKNWSPEGRIPSRDDLLLLLDMSSETRLSLSQLLQNLPPAFPSVEEWLN